MRIGGRAETLGIRTGASRGQVMVSARRGGAGRRHRLVQEVEEQRLREMCAL